MNNDSGCLLEIIFVAILIFFFWGEPDNWDKVGAIIDEEYIKIERLKEVNNGESIK